MANQHIIQALFDDWDRVNARLGAAGRQDLHDLVASMREAVTPRERNSGASRIVRFLMTRLDDDPVLDAGPEGSGHRYGTARTPDLDSALLLLASRLPSVRAADRERTADDRILSARWEPAHVLRGRGVDPDSPDVIALDREDGSRAVPVFQFDGSGAPIPVVLRVNRVLGAHRDPWGAADWWLSANVWLLEVPSALIGHTPDDRLLAAALAAVEG